MFFRRKTALILEHLDVCISKIIFFSNYLIS